MRGAPVMVYGLLRSMIVSFSQTFCPVTASIACSLPS
jgi:hypothetical protein